VLVKEPHKLFPLCIRVLLCNIYRRLHSKPEEILVTIGVRTRSCDIDYSIPVR
jgi:hypothetical protein